MWSSWPHAVFHGQHYTTGLVYIRCTITQLTYFIRYGHPTFKSYDYSNKLSFEVTKIDKVVTYQEVLSLSNSHDIKLVTGQIYISTFSRLMATKLGRVLTSARRFRMWTRKSSPTSCLFLRKMCSCLGSTNYMCLIFSLLDLVFL